MKTFDNPDDLSIAIKAAAWQAQQLAGLRPRSGVQVAAAITACQEIGIWEEYDPSHDEPGKARIVSFVQALAFEQVDLPKVDLLLTNAWLDYSRIIRQAA